jgi:hypothetical protein
MPTKKNIETPEKLLEYFERYKKYCKSNSKKEYIFVPSLKKEVGITREIPYTWDGFEIWLRKNKILAKLDDYKANKDKRYSEYADILHAIGQEIYEDKYSGAVAGVYNHNIIARDLGLKDTKEVNQKTELKINDYSNLTDEELKQKLDDLKNKID